MRRSPLCAPCPASSLANLNQLSCCRQKSLPHHDTLDHFVGHTILGQVGGVRRKMIRRLVRMKALDKTRLRGHFLVVLDATGQLAYSNTNERAKVYYLLMQIAHLILQLIEKGSLPLEDCKKLFGSLRMMATRLSESLRDYLIDPESLTAAAGIRIRLDTS